MVCHPLALVSILLIQPSTTMTAIAFVPSQVPGVRQPIVKRRDTTATTKLRSIPDGDDGDSSEAGDTVVWTPSQSQPINGTSQTAEASDADGGRVIYPPSKQKVVSKKKRLSAPRTGNMPDVHWRAIPLSHLRSHPNFRPLPPPSMIRRLPTREHVRYFRQDSWQWDYLHRGRCTTSQTAAALGFLEDKAASYLDIPKSLRRGGAGAWERLRETSGEEENESLETLERTLCEERQRSSAFGEDDGDDGDDEDIRMWRPGAREMEKTWMPAHRLRNSPFRKSPFPFAAKYLPNLTHEELCRRKSHLEQTQHAPSPMSVRMQWGNSQEATSILTALNHFCSVDDATTIREVGMCGASFDDEVLANSTLNGVKIGASPDALICHGNGIVEVLEVKNHCPFVWNRVPQSAQQQRNVARRKKSVRSGKKKGDRRRKKGPADGGEYDEQEEDYTEDYTPKHYLIRDFTLESRVPAAYIPQLMMEMLCVGDECKSAVMVRQTATKGAILLRLQRDEEWIDDMKYYLGKFQSEYVTTGRVPDDNFFWNDDADSRYRRFLRRTKELSDGVEVVAFIDHGQIQRMVLERSFGGDATMSHHIPLFLDRIDSNGGEIEM